VEDETRIEWIAVNKKEIVEFHAEFCKTFSNPTRLEILDCVKGGELTVSDIAKKLVLPKANILQHLTVMRMMRILKTRKEGTRVFYKIANKKLSRACSLMQDALAQLMEGVPIFQR